MFRILIANRGEIAIRIARAVSELGYIPLGIYIEGDTFHLIKMHDYEKVSSYLNLDEVLEAAKKLGADAIHPGYGFLSENSEFAKKVIYKGFVWIGPDPETMIKAADKVESKKIAKKVGIPTLEYKEVKSIDDILDFAEEHGYPLILKAVGGGGGRGMRIIRDSSNIKNIYDIAKREVEKSFKDSRLYVEPYIEEAKHIEVQILGDGEKIIHLYDRECSIQRRYQKVIEEAPSNIKNKVRNKILEDAIKLAKELKYKNAGTIEFLYDIKRKKYYFMEINSRLQVEHPVTECITGIDIVKNQIKIALFNELDIKQKDVKIRGHAIEARIYAENPITLLPSSSRRIEEIIYPSGPGIRVDGIYNLKGKELVSGVDPMICKIIAYGINREEAIEKLKRALKETFIKGVETNIPLLLEILNSKEFKKGNYTTKYLESNLEKFKERIRNKEIIHSCIITALIYKYPEIMKKLKKEETYPSYSSPLNKDKIISTKRKIWVYLRKIRRSISRRKYGKKI